MCILSYFIICANIVVLCRTDSACCIISASMCLCTQCDLGTNIYRYNDFAAIYIMF